MGASVFLPPPAMGGLPRGVRLGDAPPTAPEVLHFSEDGNIASFVPRPVASNPDSEPLVWAIDDAHAPLYYFPRDCPRIAFWALPTSTPADVDRFLRPAGAPMVIAIESRWLARLRRTQLFAYRFSSEKFVAYENYGAHVSRAAVEPLGVEPLGDLLDRLAARNVELRITPTLWPLRRALLSATLHYSMIRMRNAAPEETTTV